MSFSEFEIASITQDVWRAFVGLEVNGPVPENFAGGPIAGERAAAIEIHGPWSGRIVLDCAPALATAAAAEVFDVDVSSVDDEMMGAVLTELANQIGGNLKSLLPGGCVLSLPRTVQGPAAADDGPVSVVHFEREGQRFDVAVTGSFQA